MIAVPPKAPPPLESSAAQFHYPGYIHVPPIQLYRARDGSQLAYRAYPGRDDRVAVLIHGSSGDSTAMHALAKALSATGITACALDVRGHGDSGKLGDIAYVGQLDDDLADFVTVIRSRHPKAKLALVAFSAGGGFGLRFASGPYGQLFDDYVLLSPYFGSDAAVLLRPAARAWSEVDTPRVTGISVLDRIGIHWFDGLPAVAFAVPPELSQIQASTYSIRLARNFGCEPGCPGDFRSVHRPMTILVGGGDEMFYANLFPEFIAGVRPDIPVAVLGTYGHMDMIWNPQAVREVDGRIAGLLKVTPATTSAPDSTAGPAGSGQPARAALHSPAFVHR